MPTTADLDRAATAAAETLIKYHVNSAPVAPLRILKSIPGVIVLSFAELALGMGMERKELLNATVEDLTKWCNALESLKEDAGVCVVGYADALATCEAEGLTILDI